MKASDFNILTKSIKSIDLEQVLNVTLNKNKQDILDLQQEQLEEGINEKGSEIRPLYAPLTVEIKKGKGQPYDRVTLQDTGAFYRSQFIKFSKGHFEIDARDSKKKELEQKYGTRGDILGLTQRNKQQLAKWCLKDLREMYKAQVLSRMERERAKI